MLTGEYRHAIDTKKRLFIPAKHRDVLGTSFIIVRDLYDPCLKVYSMLVGKSVSINHILPVGVVSSIFVEIDVGNVLVLFILQPFLGIHKVSPASKG